MSKKILIKKYYRKRYEQLIEEWKKIDATKASYASFSGRYGFQPGVITPCEKMNRMTVNGNKRRALIKNFRFEMKHA